MPNFRNVRRLMPRTSPDSSFLRAAPCASSNPWDMSRLLRGLPDRGADAVVRPAAADVACHRGIDIGVGGVRVRRQKRRSGHHLSGLTVAALHDVELTPRTLHLLASWRVADSFDRRHLAIADGSDGQHARTDRDAVEMHGACAALRDAAAEFCSSETDEVA